MLAAGSSARLGRPKQLATLGGRPMLEWAVTAAEDALSQVLVVVSPPLAAAVAGSVRLRSAGRAPIVRAAYSGRPGHPVSLAREVWPRLAVLRGDRGACALAAAEPSLLASVEVGGDPPEDVDTQVELRRARARLARSDREIAG